jgi:nitrogen fixation protein NifQ
MNQIEIMEIKVTKFLQSYAADAQIAREVAPYVAKQSLLMNHLYEDLDLPNRFVMGQFMKKNFPQLSAKKPKNKLWKKYIYDELGLVAPACYHCKDQINCFACQLESEKQTV